MSDTATDLDGIFKDLGSFGHYQKIRWLLFIFTIWSLAVVEFTYVFTTINPKYRCLVPNCETPDHTEYKPQWLNQAVPFKDNQPERCQRFQLQNNTNYSKDECVAESFNNLIIEDCDEFVFDTNHTLIVHDFHILCDRVWRIGIPGMAHSGALFFSLPLSGYISDKLGRKRVIICGLLLAAVFNLLQSFTTSFWLFVVCEFLEAAAGSGVFTSTFILKLLEVEKRVFAGCISFFCVAIAEMSIATLAWQVESWRWFLRIASIPAFFIIFYGAFLPESIRWLISKNKFDEANVLLEKIAKENGTEFTDKHKMKIRGVEDNEKLTGETLQQETLKDVFKSIPIVLRVMTCAFCWITCAIVYHGLLLTAGEVTSNRYLNFILVATVEIPAAFISFFSCNTFGRKRTISCALTVVGICLGSYVFIPSEHSMKLILFLLGKCAITTAFGSLYIITAEIYPTPFRQTLIGICSMLGRIGSIVAPQMPVLAIFWSYLPPLIFSLFSFIAAMLSLAFLPETLNTTLPRTIDEAININKKSAENTKL